MRSAVDRTPLVSEIILVVLFALLLCAPMLDATYGGLFSYIDELAVILLIAWALLAKQKGKTNACERVALGALGVLCLFGLGGNWLFGYQGNSFAVAVDIFTCAKLFIAFFAARVVLRGRPGCYSAFCLWERCLLLLLCSAFFSMWPASFDLARDEPSSA